MYRFALGWGKVLAQCDFGEYCLHACWIMRVCFPCEECWLEGFGNFWLLCSRVCGAAACDGVEEPQMVPPIAWFAMALRCVPVTAALVPHLNDFHYSCSSFPCH